MSTARIVILSSTLAVLGALLFGCGGPLRDGPPKTYANVSNIPNAKPRYLPRGKYGNPRSYVVKGHRYYVLKSARGYNKRGIASWYGSKFSQHLTSSRERYDPWAMTAASPTLPIPTFVRVTNLRNGREVIVKVNDRGPFASNRILDLSYAAAIKLGYAQRGTALVEVQAINPANPDALPRVRTNHQPHLFLQLGAFSDINHAENLKRKVSNLTFQHVRISQGEHHQHPIYRVQVGPFKNVGESDALQHSLEKKGLGHALTVIS